MCAYAPTAKAPPRVKARFFSDLLEVVSKVPRGDVFVLLNDFNARVGRAEGSDDLWQGVVRLEQP